jgi:hypothetical protein
MDMLSTVRSLLFGSKKGAASALLPSRRRHAPPLTVRRLEDRIVLDASFDLAAGALTLHGFEDAVDDSLTVREDTGIYEFALTDVGSTWIGDDSDAGVTIDDNVLRIDKALVDSILIEQDDLAFTDFLVTVETVDLDAGTIQMDLDAGDVSFTGIVSTTGDITVTTATVITVMDNAELVTTATGTIGLTATQNIAINDGASLTTEDGGITLLANDGGLTGGNFIGIDVINATIETTGEGAISLTGTGGDTDPSNIGVRLAGGTVVQSIGTGMDAGGITITGTGGDGTTGNYGVRITGMGTAVTSFNGSIEITGTGGDGTDLGNIGAFLDGSAVVLSTGLASITVDGQGGNGTNGDHGVVIRGNGTEVSSEQGAIVITGQGGSSGSDNVGIVIWDQAVVSSTGAGAGAASITLDGTGGDGTSSNYGVQLLNQAAITSVAGTIEVIGRGGGDGSGNSNMGVILSDDSLIQVESGSLTVTGIAGAGDSFGVTLVNTNGSLISTGSGEITITATGSGTNVALRAAGNSVIGGEDAEGDITINANSIAFSENANVETAGTVTIRTQTTDGTVGIDIGGDDTATTLGLTNDELDRIAAGTIVIGAADIANTITVTAEIEHDGDADFLVVTARNILFESGSSWTTTDGDLTFLANDGGGTTGDFIGIDVNGATIDTTGEGNISLTGTGGDGNTLQIGVSLIGGTMVRSASTDPNAGGIMIDGTGGVSGTGGENNYGVEIVNSEVTSVNGDIQITGRGGDGNDGIHRGVLISSGTVVSSTGTGSDAATITIDGIGGTAGGSNRGVEISGSGTRVTTVDGDIEITGQGGGVGLGHGVLIHSGAVVSSTGTGTDAGTITIDGTGGTAGSGNHGVDIRNPDTQVTSEEGDILIIGQGGGASGSNNGVRIASGAVVSSTGMGSDAATITIVGTGGAGTTSHGVFLDNSDTRVTSEDGDVEITGTGGGTSGIGIQFDGSVTLAVDATGTANVTIEGTGAGSLAGVNLLSRVRANEGNIDISSADRIELGVDAGTGVNVESLAGNVTFEDAVLLTANVRVGAPAGTVTFESTVESENTMRYTLDVNEDEAGIDVVFNGNVGGTPGNGAELGHLIVWANTVGEDTSIALRDVSTAASGGTSGDQLYTAEEITSASDYDTGGGNFDMAGDWILQSSTTVTTGGGNITVTGTINGAQSLELTAGTGSIDLQGEVGGDEALASLTVHSATTARFGDDVETTGVQSVTADTIQTNGVHTTDESNIDLDGAVVLQDGTTLTTGGGNITVTGTINGAHSLDLTAGTGDIDLQDAVGGTTALTTLTVTSADDVTFGSMLRTTGNVTQSAGTGTTTFNGTSGTGIGGTLDVTTDAIAFNAATVTTVGAVTLNAQNEVSINTGAGLDAGASTITINANQDDDGSEGFTQAAGTTVQTTSDAADALSITVGGSGGAALAALATGDDGTVTITAGGAITNNDAAATNITAGSAALTAVGGIGSGNALETAITNLAFANTVSGDVGIDNSGALTVNSVGALATSSNVGLTVLTATSPITFAVDTTQAAIVAQAVESGTPNTDNITVNAGVTVTASDGDVLFEAGDRIIINATATVQATAAGGNVTFRSAVGDTENDGLMTLDGTVSAGATITLDLNDQQGATQAVTGTLTATNLLLLSNGGADGSFSLATSANNNVTNLAANTSGAINYHDSDDLTVTTVGATTGITSGGNVTLTANALTFNEVVNTTGSLTVTNAGLFTTAAAGDITANGGFTQNGAGANSLAGDVTTDGENISFATAVTLAGNVAMSTDTGGGNIAFSSTLDGTHALTLTAGAGNVTFTGLVGDTSRLGAVQINSAANVTGNGIRAASFTQSGGTGTTTLNAGNFTDTITEALNTTGAVSITNEVITVNHAINAGGGVTLNATDGTLTLAADADIDAGGAVSLTGSSGISTAGDVTTNDSNITFNSATTLTGNVAMSTDTGGGNIAFSSTLDGAHALTLTAGAGNVTFTGLVGDTDRLGAVQINSAANVTGNGIRAASFTQSTGTGTTTLNAGIFTDTTTEALNTAGAVDATNEVITVNHAINASGSVTLDATVGAVTSTMLGTIMTTAAAGSGTASGAVVIAAANAVNLAGTVTTTGAVHAGAGATASAGGNVTVTAGTNVAVGTITASGGDATDTGTGTTGGAAGNINLTATSGTITLNAGLTAVGGTGDTAGADGVVGLRAGGNIIDADDAVTDVVAGALAIMAAGVGTGAGVDDVLETQVSTLAATLGAGGIELSNTGDLTIGAVTTAATGPQSGISAGGAIVVTASSPLDVTEDVISMSGDIVLTAADSPDPGDDLTVRDGVTVQADDGNVILRAGDDLTLEANSTVSAAGAGFRVELFGDFDNVDAVGGSTISLLGTIVSNEQGTVTGGEFEDTIIVNPGAGDSIDSLLLDGGEGSDTYEIHFGSLNGSIDIDDSGDGATDQDELFLFGTADAEEFEITPGDAMTPGAVTRTVGMNTETVTFGHEDLVKLTLDAGDGEDTVTVTPSATMAIDLDGGDPNVPLAPNEDGDTLIYVSDGTNAFSFGADTITTDNLADITFTNFEQFAVEGDLVIDGSGDDDLLVINATDADSGTFQLTTDVGGVNEDVGQIVAFSGISGLTFNGLDGDDILRINNPAQDVFAPTNGVTFNGGDGADALEVLGGEATTVEHEFTNASDGFIFYNGNLAITYTGLAPILDTITATDRIFTFTGASETITLSDDGTADNDISRIDSTLGEMVDFLSPTGTLTIDTTATAGADIINFEGLDSEFDANLTIDAKADDDVNFNASYDFGDNNLTVTNSRTITVGTGVVLATTGDGAIDFTAARNIVLQANSSLNTVDGGITLLANDGGGTMGDFIGIDVNEATIETSGEGAISLTGTGGADDVLQIGVRLHGGTEVRSTSMDADAGGITIVGTGGGSGIAGPFLGEHHGVFVSDSSTLVTSVNGDIQITGQGGDGGDGINDGVHILSGAVVSSTGTGSEAATITIDGVGGTGGIDNVGVYIAGSDAEVTTVAGAIEIIGQGGTGGWGRGVLIVFGAVISSTGTGSLAGTITIDGTGGTESSLNHGVELSGSDALVTSIDGDIQITGQGGGDGTGTDNRGVEISDGAVVSSTGTGAGAAMITIDGTGGTGTDSNHGVFIADADTLVTSVDGDIQITGTGGGDGTGVDNHGVEISDGAVVSSTGTGAGAAMITIDGTGGTGTDSNHGVFIADADTLVTSVDGDIQITGTGGGDGTGVDNHGVEISNGAAVSSTGAGVDAATITIDGTGGAGDEFNHGVLVESSATDETRIESLLGDIQITGQGGAGTASNWGVGIIGTATQDARVTTVDGSIAINGTGGGNGTGNDNYGVRLSTRAVVSSTGMVNPNATITITGIGGDGVSDNYGVWITESTVTSVVADVQITGAGSGTGDNNYGVYINDDGNGPTLISSTGTGNDAATMTIEGTGGNGTSQNRGVWITGSMTEVTSIDGDIVITGTGGDGSADGNVGVWISGMATVSSTGAKVNPLDDDLAATITITGTGGEGTSNNHGVQLTNAQVTSVEGDIEIVGEASGTEDDNYGVFISAASLVVSTGVGASAATIMIRGTGSEDGANRNRGVWIADFGTEVTSVDGDILVTGIGTEGAGDDNVGVLVSDEAVISSTGLGIDAATITIEGTGSVLDGNGNRGVWITDPGTAVTSVDGNILVTGIGTPGTGDGNVGVLVADGAVIRSTGLALVTIEGTGSVLGGNGNRGVWITDPGTEVTSVDGNILVTGIGAQGAGDENVGVLVADGAVIRSTGLGIDAATVTIEGTGSVLGGNGNRGVWITNAGTAVTSVDGNILVTGIGTPGTGDGNVGVLVSDGAVIRSTGMGIDAATVTIEGTGSVLGGNGNRGVWITDPGTAVTSVDGNILVTGIGTEGAGDGNVGVLVSDEAVIRSTGMGIDAATVTIEGTGSVLGGNGNRGVWITDPGTEVTSVDGNILVTGIGTEGAGDENVGVLVADGAVISSTGLGIDAATVTIDGTGSEDGGDTNIGVWITNAGTAVTSVDGNILVTGIGTQGAGDENVGVLVADGAVIRSTGMALVTIDGVGSVLGGNGNRGVWITDPGTEVTSVDGNILVTGIGTEGAGDENVGVLVADGAVIRSTGLGIDAATIMIEGTGSFDGGIENIGVWITDPGTEVTSVDGGISIEGGGSLGFGVDAVGVFVSGGALIDSTGLDPMDAATITITALGNAVFGASGDVLDTLIRSVVGRIQIDASTVPGQDDGELLMRDLARIISTTGEIEMTADRDITLGNVETGNNTADAVRITSNSMGILDGGDTYLDIIANEPNAVVTLRSVTGIGATNAIDTQIAALDSSVSGTGATRINESDSIELLDVNTADGLIRVDAAASIAAAEVRSLNMLGSLGHQVHLNAGVDILADAISSDGVNGTVLLESGNNFEFVNNSVISAGNAAAASILIEAGNNVQTPANFTLTTAEGIAHSLFPRPEIGEEDTAFFEYSVGFLIAFNNLIEQLDPVNFLGGFDLFIGLPGETGMTIDIDWRDGAGVVQNYESTVGDASFEGGVVYRFENIYTLDQFLNPGLSALSTDTFFDPDSPENPRQSVTDPFFVQFRLHHHESIQVFGDSINGIGVPDPERNLTSTNFLNEQTFTTGGDTRNFTIPTVRLDSPPPPVPPVFFMEEETPEVAVEEAVAAVPEPVTFVAVVAQDEDTVAAAVAAGREEYFQIKVLSPDPNVDVLAPAERLPDDILLGDNLERLFEQLPDGQYEIEYVLGEGNERSILRFDIRQGRPVVPGEDLEGGQMQLKEILNLLREAREAALGEDEAVVEEGAVSRSGSGEEPGVETAQADTAGADVSLLEGMLSETAGVAGEFVEQTERGDTGGASGRASDESRETSRSGSNIESESSPEEFSNPVGGAAILGTGAALLRRARRRGMSPGRFSWTERLRQRLTDQR